MAFVIAIQHLVDSGLSLTEPFLLLFFDNYQDGLTIVVEISLVRNVIDLSTGLAFLYLALVMGLKRRLLDEASSEKKSNKSGLLMPHNTVIEK